MIFISILVDLYEIQKNNIRRISCGPFQLRTLTNGMSNLCVQNFIFEKRSDCPSAPECHIFFLEIRGLPFEFVLAEECDVASRPL